MDMTRAVWVTMNRLFLFQILQKLKWRINFGRERRPAFLKNINAHHNVSAVKKFAVLQQSECKSVLANHQL